MVAAASQFSGTSLASVNQSADPRCRRLLGPILVVAGAESFASGL